MPFWMIILIIILAAVSIGSILRLRQLLHKKSDEDEWP